MHLQIEKGRLVVTQQDFLDLLGVDYGSPIDPTYTTDIFQEYWSEVENVRLACFQQSV
jgi:hypothetical protein